ncbi:prepilin-type N-terminal cleavage/methylation domain-containing protein [Hoeflea poritis]|uniref:Prepilin-type N-terminal cleavage/methylation domain-containing protein n=1 Tax=Hoeflea poritis TaxID=2993659 RepID=A0ABT4VVU0_9HYPH|nr:prepilin-type N-terminal cleavage/methylation domain-containing protein [Hoeflea poritis]MDA4848837.1 prepilin-type N-terminal cleavage/methylation domain-containing protein [Hoeflea poritis]
MSEQADLRVDEDSIQGFTLVELLVGLLIVALAAGLAGFALSGRQAQESKTAFVDDAVHILRLAHRDAMMTGTKRTVAFDLDKRVVRYLGQNLQLEIPEDLEMSILVGLELVSADGTVPVAYFGEGGSTGARFTVIDDAGLKLRFETNWLTGLTSRIDSEDL